MPSDLLATATPTSVSSVWASFTSPLIVISSEGFCCAYSPMLFAIAQKVR